MPSITLTLPSAGAKITAGLHAANYSEIQALLNGGLDAGNIADLGIPSSKLDLPYQNHALALYSGGTGHTVGNGVVSARYVRIGKFVHYYGSLTLGTTTNLGSAGNLQMSLPVNSLGGGLCGFVRVIDMSTGRQWWGQSTLNISTFLPHISIGQQQADGSEGGASFINGSANIPFAWSDGDIIMWDFVYEAA